VTAQLHVRRAETALIVVDVQERLASAMPNVAFDELARNLVRLFATAERLKLPVAVSEQNPEALGRTVPVLREAAVRLSPPATFIDKMAFSVAEEPLLQTFLGAGRKTLVVVGMEAHVCVFQTARALCERGYSVHVPADGVLSRSAANWRVGLDLCSKAGATVTSTEAIIFDLLERAGTDEFRAISKLVK
jgi:nicotinamidase-related amidase